MPGQSVSAFLRALQTQTGSASFNPWTDHDPGTDLYCSAAGERVDRLQAHMSVKAHRVLVGEAAGYQGCHVSGIPFTSERLLMEGAIPRVGISTPRLTSRPRPWSEPSATVVWGTLHELGIADTTVLWNAYPWHPHKPGNRQSNRTPTGAERAAGLPVLESFLRLFPDAKVLAVGRNAERALIELGKPAIALRHPAMGGAPLFRKQLRAATV